MRKISSLAVLLTALAFLPGRAIADFITPGDFGATFEVFNQSGATSSILYAYDSATDQFSISGPVGTAAAPAVLDAFPLGAPFDATDLVANFSLTATVDSTGAVSGGSFSWVGQSASLGIAAGSVLLSGTIQSVEFLLSELQGFQIVSSVDSVNAQIAALYGPANSALIHCTACSGGAAFNFNPWSVDIAPRSPVTQGPSIFGSDQAIPEPGSLVLFGIGLAICAMTIRRRRKVPVAA